jgi:hypothetical protein
VPVAAQSLLVAESPGQRLAERDADILDRVVRVDMQVAAGLNHRGRSGRGGNLLKHVIEEGDAGGEATLAAAVEIQPNGDPGFERIPGNFCLPHRDTIAGWHFGSGEKFGLLLPNLW